MGAIISTFRDIKMIMRDLKVTLKYTAKIVLKLHGIVDDVEDTVQELKTTARNLSMRVNPNSTMSVSQARDDARYDSSLSLDGLLQSVESTAESVKVSLASTVGALVNDDLFKNTQKAWEDLLNHFGSDVPGVVAKWAGIDGLQSSMCELVSKDMDRLVEFNSVAAADFSSNSRYSDAMEVKLCNNEKAEWCAKVEKYSTQINPPRDSLSIGRYNPVLNCDALRQQALLRGMRKIASLNNVQNEIIRKTHSKRRMKTEQTKSPVAHGSFYGKNDYSGHLWQVKNTDQLKHSRSQDKKLYESYFEDNGTVLLSVLLSALFKGAFLDDCVITGGNLGRIATNNWYHTSEIIELD